MRKSFNILGKVVPVWVIAILLASGTASAALLTYYGTVTSVVNVQQAIMLDGQNYLSVSTDIIPEDAPGGELFCFKHTLTNDASVSANVTLDMSCSAVNTELGWMNCDGVTSTVYELPETTTLVLENKDTSGSWNEITGDGISGLLTFSTVSPTFDYTFEATGLQSEVEYDLIYYADPWAGSNPGKFIASFTTDVDGNIVMTSGSVELNMNLPTLPDDNYGIGAKIWLVPASDYDEVTNMVTTWAQADFLFEHNLVVYLDCDFTMADDYVAEAYGTEVSEMTLGSRTSTPILTCYEFDIAIAPGTYTLTTYVVPN